MSFPLFRYLPAEIRLEIYILATPPRFVHVKEKLVDDYEEFVDRFRTSAFSLELHPSLTHFAHNWRNCLLPYGDRPPRTAASAAAHELDYLRTYPTPAQSTLEQYGFTSSKPTPHQPWPATQDTPPLPLRWLLTQPDLAWYFTRKSYLYSNAPVPPLLHTCSESRDALIRQGYRLAFGTRTYGPRTWFHFGRDVLHLSSVGWGRSDDTETLGDVVYEANLMCQFRYSVAQFLPKDLLSVRNLSLSGLHWWDAPQLCQNFLRLFGYGVSVLYVVQWALDEEIDREELERWKDICSVCPDDEFQLEKHSSNKLPADTAHKAREKFAPLMRELVEKTQRREGNVSRPSFDPLHAVECDELEYILAEFYCPGSMRLPWIFGYSSDITLHEGSEHPGRSFWEYKVKQQPGKRTNTYFAAQESLFADHLAELLGVTKDGGEQGWWDHKESSDDSAHVTRPTSSPIPGLGDGVPGTSTLQTPKRAPQVRIVHLGTDAVMPYLEFNRKVSAMILDEMERLEEERGYPEWIYPDNNIHDGSDTWLGQYRWS